MATSPFPFFPTTTPAYVPTTVFPPPPFGFGAPPYAPYPPPNPIHHHPLPPPSPPYHYAAVYPPPPPGFVPVPASPSPIPTQIDHHFPPTPIHHPVQAAPHPSATTDHHPLPFVFSSAYAPAPESGFSPNWPIRHPAPPAPAPAPLARNPASPAAAIHPPPHQQLLPVETPPPPQYGFHNLDRRTMLLADGTVRTYFALPLDCLHANFLDRIPEVTTVGAAASVVLGADLTRGNDAGGVPMYGEQLVHKHTGSNTLSMVNVSPNHRFILEDAAAVPPVAHERVPATDTTLHRLQQQERDQLFDTIQEKERRRHLSPSFMGQPGMEPLEGKESNGVVPDCNGAAAPPVKQQQLEGADALRYANILRSRNKFADALQLYSTVLEKDGANVEALIGKGICLQAQSLLRQALECFTEAVKVDPSNACALTHCGMIYKDEGHLVEAAEAYQKARIADPSYKAAAEFLAIVLTDLGTSLKLAGNTEDGIQKYCEALEVDSHYAPAYYNLGVVYSEMMQFDAALTCYEKAALERPLYAEAYCNMGVIYKNRGELDAAIACYDRCLTISPNFEIAKNNMAIALTDMGTKVKIEGDIDKGVAYYKKALFYNWHYADAMYNLGVAYGEMLNFEMAIVFYELALHFNPRCAEACNNLGVIYKDRDNLDKAVECYQMALTIKPNFSQSLNNLGVVYTVQGKMDAAASMIEKAILANPTYAEAYNNLGVLYRDAGSITLSVQAYERCLQIDPDSRNAGQNRLLAMNYIDEGSDDKLYDAHREWGKRFMKLYTQYTTWDNSKVADRPLVIGYVSPDFFTHSVSYFVEAPLAHHDYTKCKVVVYSGVVKADAKTLRFKDKVLKKGGLWRDIYGIDEKKVGSLIREDKVDILVELTGHTANNKLGTMACRPAPIQVTWIGYPNTTGLPAIDYRITDSLADTPNTNQKHVEELVRLPESFLCYTPSPEAGPVCPTPAISNGFITFGSFNNLAKITPKVLQVWARILCAVPNSRLVVKCKPFCCDSIRQKFLSTLEELGLEPLRVDLLPLIHLNHDHMQAYSLMDISLDTFPYAGTTTTCESLYMGVPCVTMAGSVHAHNVGVSLLTKVGMGRLVAKTEDEYVGLALDLASDVGALQELRMSLRDLMIKSPVCDGEGFTRGLESAYRTMWRRYCDGDSPALRRLELLADEPGSNKEDLDNRAVKLADPRAQSANANGEEDNQAPIKVNATPEEGEQPQIMVNGVSSPEDNQALIVTAQQDKQPQIMMNGVSSSHSPSGRCEVNGHSSR